MPDNAGNPHEGQKVVHKRSCWDRFRFWLFRDSQTIDEQTEQFGRRLESLRRAAREFDQEVAKISQEDALRSLVISMNKTGRR
jgi:hypothetical protein